MRPLIALLLASLGCSHNTISPDDAGGQDASSPDGQTQPDGSSPDGSSPDGSVTPDGGKGNDQGYTAGSRLKVKYYEGADGSELAIGFYDSTLNQDCSFYPATDSTFRCMNLGAAAGAGLFTDSGCTNPIAYVTKGCAAPTTAYTYATTTSCSGLTYAVYNVSGSYTATTAYQGSPTNCVVYTAQSLTGFKASYDLYTIGSAISPSTYVQATTTVK